ncbi:Late embryogenesis abundant protein [Quillaja saponaria]|uniref:Late embryogenesis abundant protein n=1 Tax=Quillaja saponaria TaxID=32244 RepID=A0AAD7PVR0_QUISA|nr:Late embryogenesis abundant protein [Quillaja saponaria]
MFPTSAPIPSFKQDKRGQTAFHVSLTTIDSSVHVLAVGDINTDLSHGSISFHVRVMGNAWVGSGEWMKRWRLRIWCEDLAVEVSSGKLLGGGKKFTVW